MMKVARVRKAMPLMIRRKVLFFRRHFWMSMAVRPVWTEKRKTREGEIAMMA